ncbi:uncharacterized protein LOC116612021 [Nematostella vectensis]|uniref:uncharacterized protein LOC116612021 n=1 Tax=Nematostella vectensis TaxID=45351 RepID=UPI0020775A57|nr:uncharacterized protein LOC116612021 [Nematostella vectensis]
MLSVKLCIVLCVFVIVFEESRAVPQDTSLASSDKLSRKNAGAPCVGKDCEERRGIRAKWYRRCPKGALCSRTTRKEKSEHRRQNKKSFQSRENDEAPSKFAACKPDLMCKKKSDLPRRIAIRLGYRDAQDIPECPDAFWCKRRQKSQRRSFSCPPGLWCKRLAEDSTVCHEGFNCKRSVSAERLRAAGYSDSAKGCPPGLWCKRAVYAFKLNCPPGLWCKRESEDDQRPDRRENGIEQKSVKKGIEVDQRPDRQDSGVYQRLEGDENKPSSDCPPGLWCKRNNEVPRRSDKRVDRISDCPPGLWCKRGLTRNLAAVLGFKRSDSIANCPPGLWCKRSEKSLDVDCPLGYKCKRQISDDQGDLTAEYPGYETSRTMPECPRGLVCKRLHNNKNSNNQKKSASLPCPPGLWC